jgi:hypothetical protein
MLFLDPSGVLRSAALKVAFAHTKAQRQEFSVLIENS